jgi:hypothetical protein
VRWGDYRSQIACAGLTAVIGAAYGADLAQLSGLIFLGSLTAVVLSLVAIFQRRTAERIAGATLLAWVVLATWTEQFAGAASTHGLLVSAAWLVLPVAAGAVLPRAGHWWSGLACWAASFAGVAATTYSVYSVYSWAGLFVVWRS